MRDVIKLPRRRPHRERAAPAPDAEPTVYLQPRPTQTRVVYLAVDGRTVTAIMRHWREGDPARCWLCPTCRAYDDGCLVSVGIRVERPDAELFSIAGLKYQPQPDTGSR